MKGNGATKVAGSAGAINLTLSPRRAEAEVAADLSGHVHHLPCCVKFTGPSDVSHYFNPKSTGVEVDGGLAVKEAFFRGRRLQGVTVPLPEGYSGFILGKKNPSKATSSRSKASEIPSDGENSWETLAKCENMTFWNHDDVPSQDDACLRLFHWFSVAKALHEPVSAEDLSSAPIKEVHNS